jgi:hypothetical protein
MQKCWLRCMVQQPRSAPYIKQQARHDFPNTAQHSRPTYGVGDIVSQYVRTPDIRVLQTPGKHAPAASDDSKRGPS